MSEYPGVSISSTFRIVGPANFIRRVGIPLYDEIDRSAELFEPYDGRIGQDIEARSRPQADFLQFGGLATIGIFIGGWAAKKALDEAYTIILRPKIEKVLGDFFATSSTGKLYGVSLLIADKSKNFKILIVSVGTNADELAAADELVPQAIEVALNFAQAMNFHRKVHTYVISDGRFNNTPHMFQTIEQAETYVCKGSAPGRSPRYVRHDG